MARARESAGRTSAGFGVGRDRGSRYLDKFVEVGREVFFCASVHCGGGSTMRFFLTHVPTSVVEGIGNYGFLSDSRPSVHAIVVQ